MESLRRSRSNVSREDHTCATDAFSASVRAETDSEENENGDVEDDVDDQCETCGRREHATRSCFMRVLSDPKRFL